VAKSYAAKGAVGRQILMTPLKSQSEKLRQNANY
jgi:hypothetical protein